MTKSPQTTVELEDFVEGLELRVHLTRTLMQELAGEIFAKIHAIVKDLLKTRYCARKCLRGRAVGRKSN